MSNKLSASEIFAAFSNAKKEAFRLELLSHYSIPEEKESFDRYMEGQHVDLDENPEFKIYFEFIRSFIKQKKKHLIIHVVTRPLSPYLKYEISTGYKQIVKIGSEVRFVTKQQCKDVLSNGFEPCDFWLFDESNCIELLYDKKGAFLHAEKPPAKRIREYVNLKNRLLEISTPLDDWDCA